MSPLFCAECFLPPLWWQEATAVYIWVSVISSDIAAVFLSIIELQYYPTQGVKVCITRERS